MNERLYRSRTDRMLAGVAGGLAELWDVDPSLVRLIWALLVVFTGGLALLVYIVMAIVVPDEEDAWVSGAASPPASGDSVTGQPVAGQPVAGQPVVSPPPAPGAQWAAPPVDARRAARMEAKAARRAARAEGRANGGLTGAMIGGLVLVALGVFFLVREWLPQFDFDWFWPAMLILLGVIVLLTAVGRSGPRDPERPS